MKQRRVRIALGGACACDRPFPVKLAKPFLAAANKCLAQSNKSAQGAKRLRSVRVVFRYRRREMTKEDQVVGLIFQVTMWAYIAAAAAYVVIG